MSLFKHSRIGRRERRTVCFQRDPARKSLATLQNACIVCWFTEPSQSGVFKFRSETYDEEPDSTIRDRPKRQAGLQCVEDGKAMHVENVQYLECARKANQIIGACETQMRQECQKWRAEPHGSQWKIALPQQQTIMVDLLTARENASKAG